ncbi:MAG TPA: HEAT repeat domain-containing protein [Draconibacterium sp.]|nr:HEAT repeat domain-containing protein [Draconibacterium sp.]
MNQGKIDEQIKKNLFSTKTDVVISAIEAIQRKGNKLYIPVLFDLLNSSPETEIESEIINLLGTVKDKETVNSFVRAIEDDKYKGIRKSILTACWQNGLDFSTFLPVFIDLIIHEDWEIAFEAFTVADNLEYLPSPEIMKISVAKINDAMPTASEQNKYFLSEILLKLK